MQKWVIYTALRTQRNYFNSIIYANSSADLVTPWLKDFVPLLSMYHDIYWSFICKLNVKKEWDDIEYLNLFPKDATNDTLSDLVSDQKHNLWRPHSTGRTADVPTSLLINNNSLLEKDLQLQQCCVLLNS